mmetsp:Transcript_148152/g.475838  ORF Transcript_148152/g.475838 Transcript_148152/m.475838 type:complete len:80 (+) Transcript_148152:735-974(+)
MVARDGRCVTEAVLGPTNVCDGEVHSAVGWMGLLQSTPSVIASVVEVSVVVIVVACRSWWNTVMAAQRMFFYSFSPSAK